MSNSIRVRFCSREDAEAATPDPDTAVISITNPDDSANLDTTEWFAVLRVQFHDIDPDKLSSLNPFLKEDILKVYQPMEPKQAQDIQAFVVGCIDSGVDSFLVHCEAGISRSAAVAKWIADHHNGPMLGPVTKLHNRFVYRLLEACLTP